MIIYARLRLKNMVVSSSLIPILQNGVFKLENMRNKHSNTATVQLAYTVR